MNKNLNCLGCGNLIKEDALDTDFCLKCSKGNGIKPNYDIINDKIILGSYDIAKNLDLLQSLKVFHIVNCAKSLENKFIDKFNYLSLDLEDEDNIEIQDKIKETINFIENNDGIVYIHCRAGISRSAAITIAYIMFKDQLDYESAYKLVKERRRNISPNLGFVKQLNNFDKYLLKNNYKLN